MAGAQAKQRADQAPTWESPDGSGPSVVCGGDCWSSGLVSFLPLALHPSPSIRTRLSPFCPGSLVGFSFLARLSLLVSFGLSLPSFLGSLYIDIR